MRTRNTMAAMLFAAASLLGCEDEPASPPAEAVEEPAAAADPGAAAEPEAEELSEEELPIAEDFADEAEEAINADNYESELDSIAAEIDGELGGSGD